MNTIDAKTRWAVLDVLKAVCVIAMVVGHNLIWWYFSYKHGSIVSVSEISTARFLFGTIALFVMSIPITAGMALRFFLRAWWNQKHQKLFSSTKPLLGHIFLTAIFLTTLGFLLNFFTWDTEQLLPYLFSWNVLQFFSVSLIAVALILRFLNLRFLLAAGSVVLFTAPFLRNIFQSDGVSYLEMIFFGYPNGLHIWPFFPWFATIVFGFWLADFFLVRGNKKFNLLLATLGFSLSLFALIGGSFNPTFNPRDIWGSMLFQPSTLHVLGQCGFITLFLLTLNLIFVDRKIAKYGIFNIFSHGILYIYLFHFAFGLWLTTLLRPTEKLIFLFLSLLIQFTISYLIGVLVVFLKTRTKLLFDNSN
ncbi:MAG: heparan-alpha-glucosaminide N-acetyltransferase domain-containing protein [Candidatus Peribacteraceae bacterium]|nr:heparan-alpha-glucosaminide N-acetyltransferase domain-containing protein [Candidatus Peribacteraceae bacterium]